MDSGLLKKYNVPGPRYTSYPTVPYWDQGEPDMQRWINLVRETFTKTNETEGISLYLHLPFCERMCTFCGCNKRITVNHRVEEPYISDILKEWWSYRDLFDKAPKIKEIHYGGGTPTFFSPENLSHLTRNLLENTEFFPGHEMGFEAHPGVTTKEHLKTMYYEGFRRVSFGVQDFDEKVLQTINRPQTWEQVREAHETARELGYNSVNWDLVYGLPHQSISCIEKNVEKVALLKPDRIAFYSYAHVPWVSPGQRGYEDADLPGPEEKRALYEHGRNLLEAEGYVEIGMDHFALKTDALYIAATEGRLHRNFMGYSPNFNTLMIGLGVSAISDAWGAFMQNHKKLEDWRESVAMGDLPVFRGHFLNEEDLVLRQHILNIMCRLKTSWNEPRLQNPAVTEAVSRLDNLVNDGLLTLSENSLEITETGKPFIRNICMAFDARLWRNQPETSLFSQTI